KHRRNGLRHPCSPKTAGSSRLENSIFTRLEARGVMEIGGMLIVELASVLFSTGLSAAKEAYRKRTQIKLQKAGKLRDEARPDAGESDANTWPEHDGLEDVLVAVGMELAMKAQRQSLSSRPPGQGVFKGLSAGFAAHRSLMHGGISEIAANLESASQAIAEELV
ncbi:unnamed protein product, partial [Scytosiphon promiscuus]